MPGKERTRRPGHDQLDLTALLATDPGPVDEDDAQARMRRAAAALEPVLGDPDAALWADSPYRWIRDLATSRKSKAAERLVAAFLASGGLVVSPARDSGHAFTVAGNRVKVRMSMRWGTGEFVFQQVLSGDYDQVCLVGISPDQVRLWLVDRAALAGHVDPATGWLSFPSGRPPQWLNGHGGGLDRALPLFGQLT